VAVSPLAYNPARTLVHEIAHNVVGHMAEGETEVDTEALGRSERESEAEGTAHIVLSVLGLPGLEESRGYLQAWNGGRGYSERSAARVFKKAADRILKAGTPAETPAETEAGAVAA
jgi:hypothetical protein